MAGNVITTLIILIASVVLGAGIIFFGESMFQHSEYKNLINNQTIQNMTGIISEEHLTSKGVPRSLSLELISTFDYRVETFTHTQDQTNCIFIKSAGPFNSTRTYSISCISYPGFTERVLNDTISITFSSDFRDAVLPLIEKYNQQGYELKSMVPIVQHELPNGKVIDMELLYAVLQK